MVRYTNKYGKRGCQVLAVTLGLFGTSLLSMAASTVTSIDFKGTPSGGELAIKANGAVTFEKQDNPQDKQIIIDLKGAKLSKAANRKVDTSSFPGQVKLISPYQLEGQEDAVRVVVQLRDNVKAEASQDGNVIRVKIGSASSDDQAAAEQPSPPAAVSPIAASAPQEPAAPVPDADSASTETAAAGAGNQDKLTRVLEARETGRFSGKPITLQVRDADINDVLRLISDASGFNIVVGDDVKGRITLALDNVPWDQALDVVLKTMKLGAERNNNLLRVVTLTALTAERQQELAAKKAALANAPMVTKIFPVSYADPAELAKTLNSFSSGSTGASQGLALPSATAAGLTSSSVALIQIDKRTNSLIVQDTVEHVEKIRKLVQLLDTETPQVMIEAKVIEASETFTKSIGGSLGFGNSTGSTQFLSAFNNANPTDALIGTPGVFANGAAVNTGVAGQSNFGVSPTLSFIPGIQRLNAVLNLAETEATIKVVSSPRTVVLNKQTATVLQSTPVGIPTTTISNGTVITTLNVVQANISLNVTPTVTNDGSVQMDLNLDRGVPVNLQNQAQGVANRSLVTKVLVESGTTLVIGGVYTMNTDHASSGFPFLRKIPILGFLFGNESDNTTRSELFFFITPRILNPKEAGLNG
jgi:type IV pilus assembly protein PilQ